MDHYVGKSTSLNPGQALAVATLNIVLTLAYKEVNFSTETYMGIPYQRFFQIRRDGRRYAGSRNRDKAPFYCTYYHSHSHNTTATETLQYTPRLIANGEIGT